MDHGKLDVAVFRDEAAVNPEPAPASIACRSEYCIDDAYPSSPLRKASTVICAEESLPPALLPTEKGPSRRKFGSKSALKRGKELPPRNPKSCGPKTGKVDAVAAIDCSSRDGGKNPTGKASVTAGIRNQQSSQSTGRVSASALLQKASSKLAKTYGLTEIQRSQTSKGGSNAKDRPLVISEEESLLRKGKVKKASAQKIPKNTIKGKRNDQYVSKDEPQALKEAASTSSLKKASKTDDDKFLLAAEKSPPEKPWKKATSEEINQTSNITSIDCKDVLKKKLPLQKILRTRFGLQQTSKDGDTDSEKTSEKKSSKSTTIRVRQTSETGCSKDSVIGSKALINDEKTPLQSIPCKTGGSRAVHTSKTSFKNPSLSKKSPAGKDSSIGKGKACTALESKANTARAFTTKKPTANLKPAVHFELSNEVPIAKDCLTQKAHKVASYSYSLSSSKPVERLPIDKEPAPPAKAKKKISSPVMKGKMHPKTAGRTRSQADRLLSNGANTESGEPSVVDLQEANKNGATLAFRMLRCRFRWCASNQIPYEEPPPAPMEPRKYLISKRHLLKTRVVSPLAHKPARRSFARLYTPPDSSQPKRKYLISKRHFLRSKIVVPPNNNNNAESLKAGRKSSRISWLLFRRKHRITGAAGRGKIEGISNRGSDEAFSYDSKGIPNVEYNVDTIASAANVAIISDHYDGGISTTKDTGCEKKCKNHCGLLAEKKLSEATGKDNGNSMLPFSIEVEDEVDSDDGSCLSSEIKDAQTDGHCRDCSAISYKPASAASQYSANRHCRRCSGESKDRSDPNIGHCTECDAISKPTGRSSDTTNVHYRECGGISEDFNCKRHCKECGAISKPACGASQSTDGHCRDCANKSFDSDCNCTEYGANSKPASADSNSTNRHCRRCGESKDHSDSNIGHCTECDAISKPTGRSSDTANAHYRECGAITEAFNCKGYYCTECGAIFKPASGASQSSNGHCRDCADKPFDSDCNCTEYGANSKPASRASPHYSTLDHCTECGGAFKTFGSYDQCEECGAAFKPESGDFDRVKGQSKDCSASKAFDSGTHCAECGTFSMPVSGVSHSTTTHGHCRDCGAIYESFNFNGHCTECSGLSKPAGRTSDTTTNDPCRERGAISKAFNSEGHCTECGASLKPAGRASDSTHGHCRNCGALDKAFDPNGQCTECGPISKPPTGNTSDDCHCRNCGGLHEAFGSIYCHCTECGATTNSNGHCRDCGAIYEAFGFNGNCTECGAITEPTGRVCDATNERCRDYGAIYEDFDSRIGHYCTECAANRSKPTSRPCDATSDGLCRDCGAIRDGAFAPNGHSCGAIAELANGGASQSTNGYCRMHCHCSRAKSKPVMHGHCRECGTIFSKAFRCGTKHRGYVNREEERKAEEVKLRRQEVEERKLAGEFMLDSALGLAVQKLAPDGEIKVKVLVEAYETVLVAAEDLQQPCNDITPT